MRAGNAGSSSKLLQMSAPTSINRVVVINDDATERGGAAAIALASARLLRSRNVPITYLSGDPAGADELARAGVQVSVLGGRHILEGSRATAALRGLYDPTTRAALKRWMAANDTPGTVYHLHNWHKVLSPSIFEPLRDVAFRLVISAHDYFLACPNGGYFIYPRQSPCEIRPGSLRCIATDCDRRHYAHKLWRVVRHQMRQQVFDLHAPGAVVLTVHDGLIAHFASAGIAEQNLRTLRNPVTPWRSDRVLAEQNQDVFFVGRIDEDKGVDLLARAAQRAGVRVQLIGDGSLAAALASDYPNLQLHGWKSREQIAEMVGNARMVVLPTRCRETFGLVALEALTSGIPVIISRFAMIADEVAQHGFGAMCDPYDEAALAETIGNLARDDERVEGMSRRAFAYAHEMAPTPAEWCGALLRLYADRLGGGNASHSPETDRWQIGGLAGATAGGEIGDIR